MTGEKGREAGPGLQWSGLVGEGVVVLLRFSLRYCCGMFGRVLAKGSGDWLDLLQLH